MAKEKELVETFVNKESNIQNQTAHLGSSSKDKKLGLCKKTISPISGN